MSLLGLGLGLAGATFGYNMFSNERNRNDYNKQQEFANQLALRQQDFSEYMAHNAVQVRRDDLEKAGLHPSLAAGGQGAQTTQGHMPSGIGAHQNKAQSVMENALFTAALKERLAQVDKVKAEASNIRANTLLTEGRNSREALGLTYDSAYLGIAQQRNVRESELHGQQLQNLIYKNAVAKFGEREAEIHLADSRVKAGLNWFQHQYMSKHRMHMPTADSLTQEIDNIIKNDGVGQTIDRNIVSGLKILRMLLRR